MEDKSGIHILKLYEKRQVIINVYQDDELINKNGYIFDYIQASDYKIDFIRENQSIYHIDRFQFPVFKKLEEFQDYFSFSNQQGYIELYFPH